MQNSLQIGLPLARPRSMPYIRFQDNDTERTAGALVPLDRSGSHGEWTMARHGAHEAAQSASNERFGT